jgi:P4 family phage/plasmid primase-like protien
VTENDRTRLETQLEEVKKSVNKENGSLGGRPSKDAFEPDVLAEIFLKAKTDKQGIPLFYCLENRWYGYINESWKAMAKKDIGNEVSTYFQSLNAAIDQRNMKRITDARNEALKKGEKFEEKKVPREQRYSTAAGNIQNIVANLESYNMCGRRSFMAPIWFNETQNGDRPNGLGWLNVANCIINVDEIGRAFAENKPIPDGAVRQHSPAFFCLWQQLPVKFNPDAKCPNFEKFLCEVQPDGEARKHLQMMAGYFLMVGDHRFNVFFILYGQGGTGKSTTARVFYHLFGAENVSALEYNEFGERFQIAMMKNKILNIDEDMAKTGEKDASHDREGVLKKLADGNLIKIEEKGIDSETAQISAKCLFCTNNMPYIKDTSGAFDDRERIITFNQRFRNTQQEINSNKLEKILTTPAELEGVLNWGLKGWGMLRGLACFPELEESKSIKAAIQELQWPSMAYIQENLTYDVNGFIQTKIEYEKYKKWAEDNNQRPESLTHFCENIRAQFPKAKYGQRREGTERQRGFFGLKQINHGLSLHNDNISPDESDIPRRDESDIDF